MAYNKELQQLGILPPSEKLKVLSNYSDAVEIDPNVPARRYFRSGVEMIRMADVYMKEGGYENAYILYMKYMTLFLEKIRKHPEYASVPVNTKSVSQAKLREILPIAEKLKKLLLEQYNSEYTKLIEDLKRQKAKEKQAIIAAKPQVPQPPPAGPTTTAKWMLSNITPVPFDIDNVVYPDADFTPSAPSPEASNVPEASDCNAPRFDRNAKPPSSYSLDATVKPLRTVLIPSEIMNQFLMLAKRNTMTNVETCGLLAGDLERNHLVITTLIVPKQQGTPDSCAMMNEEELFSYQDEHNLITIGWIHTHPTQTAFLSSVDLHTHCPYQILLPEAIAIVCAPKYNETGFFVLTSDYGLSFVSNCQKQGFHPHPTDPPLFTNADHIKLDDAIPLTVKDFRIKH